MVDNIKKYKDAWKNQSQSLVESEQLREEHIMDFIARESTGIVAKYRKSLLVDVYIKAGLLLSFVLLAFLLKATGALIGITLFLCLASGAMLVKQIKFYRDVGLAENQSSPIKDSLESKITYLKKRWTKAIYLAATSSPLFFLSGSLYYFYFKYGTVRPFDMDDYMVFFSGVTISFLLAVFAQLNEHYFQIRQLESCLNDLDEEAMNRFIDKKRTNRRLLLLLMGAGLVVLVVLFVFYVVLA